MKELFIVQIPASVVAFDYYFTNKIEAFNFLAHEASKDRFHEDVNYFSIKREYHRDGCVYIENTSGREYRLIRRVITSFKREK